VSYDTNPSSYVCIDREWNKGDVVQIRFPMHNTVEQMPNVHEYIAFMHGPILLSAKTGTENLKGLIADDGRWSQYAAGEYLPVDKAPILIEDNIQNIADKLVSVKDKSLNFKLDVKMINKADLTLQPFFQIHDARYMMYWLALTPDEYQTYLESLANIEKEKLLLEKRTVDFVATGEQQPETDHSMQIENSNTGNNLDEFWREASDGGYFSYNLFTNYESNLSLYVRYWGAEWGNRKFEIYIDDEKLVTEDNTGRWNQSLFKDIVYEIPKSMIENKKNVRVKFQSFKETTAGAVYMVRLLRTNSN
ncbi:MAG: glycoside hydrolase family 127 protein, partial [Ignavibacteriae bacterium]|nr:glycoside hydrolase family 127 protein [Ignavibacteriota bacterium]